MRLASICWVLSCLALASMTSASSAQTPSAKGFRPQIRQGTLNEGDAAPDFSLRDVADKNSVSLSALQGKPVVLVFGSCTCPPFVSATKACEGLYASYKDKAHFYLVYIREAHPVDGWALANNRFKVNSPKSAAERHKLAQDFAAELKLTIPVLVDSIDDRVEKLYATWPNRLYILDADGQLVDKGVAGPGGVATSAKRAAEVLDKLLAKPR